jgi:hypothetical protein
MASFSLRVLILVAIGAILILRTVRRFGHDRSGRVPTAARPPPLETPSASIVARRWRVGAYFAVVVAHGAARWAKMLCALDGLFRRAAADRGRWAFQRVFREAPHRARAVTLRSRE